MQQTQMPGLRGCLGLIRQRADIRGQTEEKLSGRVSRHLTNQRSDAVAMNVLDPFEVAEIEVWPFWELQNRNSKNLEAKAFLNAAEYTAFEYVLSRSGFKAVLNEKEIVPTGKIDLPPSVR